MKTIVIMPAYNEGTAVGKVVKDIACVDPAFDICVINDGSSDNTCENARNGGAVVLNHIFNLGYGTALQTGYKYALKNNYDIIVQIDADGQHDPAYIPEMIRMLSVKKADVIIGSRFKTKTQYKASLVRRIGMIFFGFLVSMITRKKVNDSTSGYQVIKKDVLPFLVSDSFPCDYPDADFLIMLHYLGFKTREFPVEMRQSKNKKSLHHGPVRNLYYIFKMCLSIFLTIISEKIKKLGGSDAVSPKDILL